MSPMGLDLELATAALKLVRDVLKVKEGEEVVITADTGSDWRVVEETAKTVALLNAKPMVVWYKSPPGVGKAADPHIPLRTLTAVLSEADVWIEFNKSWLLYSTPYETAIKAGKVRYICLVGMDADMYTRTIGKVNIPLIYEFQKKLAEITARQRHMKITTPAGTDLEFENDKNRPIFTEGEVNGPGVYMLFGQVDWAPIEDSINGVLVFDGSIWPPQELGLLRNPIKLHIKEGQIVKIEGGPEAKILKAWLESFNHPNMYKLAHISYGCNPGAKLTGNILEDERVWGAIEWGIGYQSPDFKGKVGNAPSHTDGICLSPTVTGDEEKIIENGEYVHPELVELAKKLRLNI
uniref:Aminopeptidase n=1 Tax=Thermofilum adornatum TaxID=1365176 RepID=A0A7C1GK85_9CREN